MTGKRIKEERKKLGLKPKQLAEMMEITTEELQIILRPEGANA